MSRQAILIGVAIGAVCFLGGMIAGSAVTAQSKFPTAKTLFTQDLADIEGYEAQIIEVSLDPGAQLGGHRHSGHMFVYVVEGEIASQLEDGEKITYAPGDFWYEHPMMLHADFVNPSDTAAAKAVIFSVVEEGKPQTILEPHAH
jgi:quercetin dioxygenase-like cupin family protein